MATYFQASPIGAGMSNLANAISGLPERDAKMALLAAQQKKYEDDLLTNEAQRRNFDSQSRLRELEYEGRNLAGTGASNYFLRVQPGSGGAGGAVQPPPSDTPPSLSNAVVSGVGNVPGGAAPPTLPSPAAGPAMTPPPQGPSVANAVVAPDIGMPPQPLLQKPPLAPRQQAASDLIRGSYMAGADMVGKMPEAVLGLGAWANAETPEGQPLPFNDRQLTNLQTGAKKDYQGTISGQREVIKQRADEATQKDATKRYEIGVESADRRRGQDKADARASAKKGNAASIKPSDWKTIDKFFAESGGPGTAAPNGEQLQTMRNRFMELYEETGDKVAAANQVADEAWGDVTTPGKKNWIMPDEPDKTSRQFVMKTRPRISLEEAESKRSGETPTAKVPDAAKRVVGKTTVKGTDGKTYVWASENGKTGWKAQ